MSDCVFCKIIAKQIKADIVYEQDGVVAFNDLYPKYKTHVIIIPVKHLVSVAEMQEADDELVGKLMRIGAKIARERGLENGGYRLLTNIGVNAGQTVQHLHIHLLGGEKLRPL
ncbi:MAG: histidine triad nucleotide-binding protein [bacterium]|nr:histidine triad nucleotide-binding protein [bacterium]